MLSPPGWLVRNEDVVAIGSRTLPVLLLKKTRSLNLLRLGLISILICTDFGTLLERCPIVCIRMALLLLRPGARSRLGVPSPVLMVLFMLVLLFAVFAMAIRVIGVISIVWRPAVVPAVLAVLFVLVFVAFMLTVVLPLADVSFLDNLSSLQTFLSLSLSRLF